MTPVLFPYICSCDPNRPTQSSDLYSVGCVLSQLTSDQVMSDSSRAACVVLQS